MCGTSLSTDVISPGTACHSPDMQCQSIEGHSVDKSSGPIMCQPGLMLKLDPGNGRIPLVWIVTSWPHASPERAGWGSYGRQVGCVNRVTANISQMSCPFCWQV